MEKRRGLSPLLTLKRGCGLGPSHTWERKLGLGSILSGEKAWAGSLLEQKRRRGHSPLLKLKRRRGFCPLLQPERRRRSRVSLDLSRSWRESAGLAPLGVGEKEWAWPLVEQEKRLGLSSLLELERSRGLGPLILL